MKKKNQSGQALLEYILLLSIVVSAVFFMLKDLRGGLDYFTAKTGGTLERQLRTGSVGPEIWTK